ncbi:MULTISPECIES: DNA polymerase IV [unclassified Rhizobium]|uniref:DNA polymerase IV n=1 Tax=unclassified Rhizobium TaxID=2613769 RepID=UPI0007EB383B|nr:MULTISPECIES: DNA polymerase IV [unclassified Rhizobium]ANM13319.1 DNA polymerase IV 2 [Rhizobium sp. N324]ANM19720.1 DNA polymerase IV 2 [Rhizobium sp. N541]ANM26105.1 DNA polymerase IV 2 [Rhizobium sp. N941]OYD01110.1 DNA polymerase IV 2 [Rhizobium sp. N4311]
MSSTPFRKIVHVDMDAFYASVEQRDNPELRGKPIAVGGSAARGVVAAASYEARAYGIHSAMPSVTARRKCPDLIFVPPRFDVYKAVSQQIREIFAEYTPDVEPLSLDEAYLDVTENLRGMQIATDIAREIRTKIKQITGLNASAGISYNKFLAKMASDLNKPNGQAVITPKNGPAFVEALPVKKFHGVGPATTEKMHRLGIETGADLKQQTLEFLVEHFGKSGPYFYGIARGVDERQVRPNRVRKSVGAEDTFSKDLHAYEAAREGLQPLIEKVWGYCEANGIGAKTVTLKVKYADFNQITRSKTIPAPLAAITDLEDIVSLLLAPVFPPRKGVRLLGVSLSSLERQSFGTEPQLRLAL